MNSNAIIASIGKALECEFDREAAVKRLAGSMGRLTECELVFSKEHGAYRFYEVCDGKRKYLKKDSKRLYVLARKRYCKVLIKLLQGKKPRHGDYLKRLRKLLQIFEAGGLELERIVYTNKQYNWYKGTFKRKEQGDASHKLEDYFVRSKSEQKIGEDMLKYAVPFHFEELLMINVSNLVEKLQKYLETEKFYNWEYSGKLNYKKDDSTIWLVPAELKWMNSAGSIWKTYDNRYGKVTLYPDFKIMLADGTVIYWEHEGLAEYFAYRCNANERVSVMLLTRTVEAENMIVTYEFDTDDKERLTRILEEKILPRLWW